VLPGIERFLHERPPWATQGTPTALLVHPASVDPQLNSTVERLLQVCPGLVKALLAPQHGLWGEKQDNMVASPHEGRTRWGIPAFSLYGEDLRPTAEMLQGIEVLLIDLQDVGCRVYTYAATLLACLEACAEMGIRVAVADRPNPIGGLLVEGNLLQPEMVSLVGPHPLPMRHGLTLGELARLFVAERGLTVDLEIIPMAGWSRSAAFAATALPWVPPSPNMPTTCTCSVYPGQVLLEGTNLSEGRGTTRPFEIFGAPFIDPFHLRDRLEARRLPGIRFRALYFEPTFHKWAEQRCGGLQLHVTDPAAYRPYLTTLWILHEVLGEWGTQLNWRDPPYEYETERLPLDLLIGDPAVRRGLESGTPPDLLESSWAADLQGWIDRREAYLVYPQ
jgi:uncharacterized protein YbbC (DUF1343 family)